jgi:retinol dehydrogenase-12
MPIQTILPLFIQPFRTLHLPAPDSFKSQPVIITGSNTGIGLETAKHIVSLGAPKVILSVRSLSKGFAAKVSIESSTGRTGVVKV